jgi:Secretion system C-terminal sorting domain
MRKNFTLFAFVSLLSLGLQAQFVRTDIGDVADMQRYRRADTTGVVEGMAGSGVTWNFTSLTPTSFVGDYTYMAPSGHPQGGLFSSANLALQPANGNYAFYISSSDSLYMIGEKSPSNTTITYTDGAMWFRFPQAFGVPNQDSVYGDYPDGFISTVSRAGWIQTTFDGQGTLTTPFGTFNNAKRIEYIGIHHDSSWTGAAEVDVFIKRYEWYDGVDPMPRMIINRQQVILNGGNPTNSKEVWYADDNAVSVTPQIAGQFSISPNPAQGHTRLSYTLDAADNVQVEVMNLLGERVSMVVKGEQAAGSYTYDLGANLAAGVYMVRMQSSAGVTTHKVVLN